MSELQHVKVTTPELQDDGTVMYTTESYYDKLSFTHVELEKHIKTTRNDLLKDLISCLDSNKEINLRVRFKHGQPFEIVKRWYVSKEDFGRR